MDASELDQHSRLMDCLPKIKNLFRIMEVLLIFICLTLISVRLPFAARITSEYIRQFITLLVRPFYIFLLTNLIVLALFFKSGQHLPEHSRMMELCQDIIAGGDDGTSMFQPDQDKSTIVDVTKDDQGRIERECRKHGLEAEKQRRNAVDSEEVEELSNDEFQRAIEAFIARQIKFHEEEEVAIVFP